MKTTPCSIFPCPLLTTSQSLLQIQNVDSSLWQGVECFFDEFDAVRRGTAGDLLKAMKWMVWSRVAIRKAPFQRDRAGNLEEGKNCHSNLHF